MYFTMKKHNGMRPQDIVILLKIVAMQDKHWNNSMISLSLGISASEVSEALNRCRIARLIDNSKTRVFTNALNEFLIYGLKYVFPAQPGTMQRGIPTAHSASPIKEHIAGVSDNYVWPYHSGNVKGLSIEPLYKSVPESALKDPLLYELLVIVDTLRIGRAREIQIAISELANRMEYVDA